MSLPHFYLSEQVLANECGETFPLHLEPDDARHAHVLRLAAGERIAVVDAVKDYFTCEIVAFDAKLPVVRIAQRLERAETGASVVLVQGLAKGDKMETVIRHATELGVSEFLPLMCERSVVRLDVKKVQTKTERWRAIAKSAAMQSGQRVVPTVVEPATLGEMCKQLGNMDALLVCWEEAPETLKFDVALDHVLSDESATPGVRVAIVVGPEGGLTEREVEALLACNPHSSLVSLGPSILRTETAGIVAPALLLYELERRTRAGSR